MKSRLHTPKNRKHLYVPDHCVFLEDISWIMFECLGHLFDNQQYNLHPVGPRNTLSDRVIWIWLICHTLMDQNHLQTEVALLRNIMANEVEKMKSKESCRIHQFKGSLNVRLNLRPSSCGLFRPSKWLCSLLHSVCFVWPSLTFR